jgi:hypothetical protein
MDDYKDQLTTANESSRDPALSVTAGTVNASIALVAKLFQPEGASLRAGPDFGPLKRDGMVLVKAMISRLVLQGSGNGQGSGQDSSSAVSAAAAGLRFLAGLLDDPSLVVFVWQELFKVASHRPEVFRAAVKLADVGAELTESLRRTAAQWCGDVLALGDTTVQQQPKPIVVTRTAKMMVTLAKYQATFVQTFARCVARHYSIPVFEFSSFTQSHS